METVSQALTENGSASMRFFLMTAPGEALVRSENPDRVSEPLAAPSGRSPGSPALELRTPGMVRPKTAG